MCAKLLQLCPTLHDPVDCSLLGSSVHGILQARILKWVAFPSPGDLPDPRIEPRSSGKELQADSLPLSPWRSALIKYTEHGALCSVLLLIIKTLTLDVQERGKGVSKCPLALFLPREPSLS